MIGLQARLGGRRWLAVTIMTLAMLLLLVVPLVLAVSTIVDYADDIVGWSKSVATIQVPPPPDWVERVPLLGSKIATEWRKLAATPPEELVARATPLYPHGSRRPCGAGGRIRASAPALPADCHGYRHPVLDRRTAAKGVRRFGRRLAGDRGDDSVVLAGQAIRAVALGVVVTAIAQSAAAGLGLFVSGIPYAGLLTAVIFMSVYCAVGAGPYPGAGGGVALLDR